MKLIVGLGNPGEQYVNTRHNIGFMILEKIVEKKDIIFNFDKSFESKIADINIDGKIKLIEPQTFMNNSGRAVVKVKNYWKISGENIWTLSDDVDLEFGKVRISFGGSSAGHKGIQSIIDSIGDNFWRVRVGIGKDEKIETEKWVLQKFTENQEKLSQIVDRVSEEVLNSLSTDLKEKTFNI